MERCSQETIVNTTPNNIELSDYYQLMQQSSSLPQGMIEGICETATGEKKPIIVRPDLAIKKYDIDGYTYYTFKVANNCE